MKSTTIATRQPDPEVLDVEVPEKPKRTATLTVRERRLAMFGKAALEQCGFTDRFMRKAMRRLYQGLDATVPTKKKTIVSKDGTTTTVEDGGAPDWSTRMKAIEKTVKIADAFPRGKTDVGKDREPFTVEVVTYTDEGGTKTAVRVRDGKKD